MWNRGGEADACGVACCALIASCAGFAPWESGRSKTTGGEKRWEVGRGDCSSKAPEPAMSRKGSGSDDASEGGPMSAVIKGTGDSLSMTSSRVGDCMLFLTGFSTASMLCATGSLCKLFRGRPRGRFTESGGCCFGVRPGLPLIGLRLFSRTSDLRGRPLRFFADGGLLSSSFRGTLVVMVEGLSFFRGPS